MKSFRQFIAEAYRPNSEAEKNFIDKHVTVKHGDRNGNKDDVFNTSKVKKAERKADNHGYEPGEDEEVYEAYVEPKDLNFNNQIDSYHKKVGGTRKGNNIHYKPGEGDFGAVATNHLSRHGWKNTKNPGEMVHKHGHRLTTKNEKKKDGWHTTISFHEGDVKEELDETFKTPRIAHKDVLKKLNDGVWSTMQDVEPRKHIEIKHNETGKKRTIWVEENELDELNRHGILSRYSNKTKDNPDRKEGRNLALKKKWGDKNYGLPEPKVKGVDRVSEESEELDELSKKTLMSYVKQAPSDGKFWDREATGKNGPVTGDEQRRAGNKSHNRTVGVNKAVKKIQMKNEEALEELSRKTLGSYIKKAHMKSADDSYWQGRDDGEGGKRPFSNSSSLKKYQNKEKGIRRATDRLTKEDVINRTIDKYIKEDDYTLEEKVLLSITHLSDYDIVSIMELFETLSEDNQKLMYRTMQYESGIDEILDFVIENTVFEEETEELDEISKKTLGSYIKKASRQASDAQRYETHFNRDGEGDRAAAERKHRWKRQAGVDKAVDKLTKEEVEQVDESNSRLNSPSFRKAQQNLKGLLDGSIKPTPKKSSKNDEKTFHREKAAYHKAQADHHRERHDHHHDQMKEHEDVIHELKNNPKNFGFEHEHQVHGAIEEMDREREKHQEKKFHHEDSFHHHTEMYKHHSGNDYKGKLKG